MHLKSFKKIKFWNKRKMEVKMDKVEVKKEL